MQFGYSKAGCDIGDYVDSFSFVAGKYDPRTTPMYFYHKLYLRTSKDLFYPSIYGTVPDTKSVANAYQCCIKRFATLMPDAEDKEGRQFHDFVVTLSKLVFKPIDFGNVPTIDEYLAGTHYNQARKKQIRDAFLEQDHVTQGLIGYMGFGKLEQYMDDKTMRGINTPSDSSKALLAGLISVCDKSFFSSRWFVKGTNPADLPKTLREMLGNKRVYATDFSSMESHHEGWLGKAVLSVYEHMLSSCPITDTHRRILTTMFMGTRKIRFAGNKVSLGGRLMSGAQWTSGANSLLNFTLIAYMMSSGLGTSKERAEWVRSQFIGKFEGDDGIFDATRQIDLNIASRLGLKLKIESFANVELAGFCGNYLAPDCDQVLKAPLKALANFFAMPMRYYNHKDTKVLALLRARALSYSVQYGGCPILGALSYKVLSLTASIDVRCVLSGLEQHKQDLVTHALNAKIWSQDQPSISDATRSRYEELFDMTVPEQLRIEKAISEMTLEGGACDLRTYWTNVQYDTTYLLRPSWDGKALMSDVTLADAPDVHRKALIAKHETFHEFTGPADARFRGAIGRNLRPVQD